MNLVLGTIDWSLCGRKKCKKYMTEENVCELEIDNIDGLETDGETLFCPHYESSEKEG